jgi:hypothetical protein
MGMVMGKGVAVIALAVAGSGGVEQADLLGSKGGWLP